MMHSSKKPCLTGDITLESSAWAGCVTSRQTAARPAVRLRVSGVRCCRHSEWDSGLLQSPALILQHDAYLRQFVMLLL